MCFSKFISNFYVTQRLSDSFEKDLQSDEHVEPNHPRCILSDDVSIMSSTEKLKCLKVKPALRYHKPNTNKDNQNIHIIFSFRFIHLEIKEN